MAQSQSVPAAARPDVSRLGAQLPARALSVVVLLCAVPAGLVMNEDIVTRLRDCASHVAGKFAGPHIMGILLIEAADEIERLRAVAVRARAALKDDLRGAAMLILDEAKEP